jgi:hypothetical protein
MPEAQVPTHLAVAFIDDWRGDQTAPNEVEKLRVDT